MREAFLVRAELESLATELAVPRITERDLAELEEAEHRFARLTDELRRRSFPATDRAQLVAEWVRANHAFHDIIYRVAAVSLVERMAKSARFSGSAVWAPADASELDELYRMNEAQHSAIIGALRARSTAGARALAREHVLASGRLLARIVSRPARAGSPKPRSILGGRPPRRCSRRGRARKRRSRSGGTAAGARARRGRRPQPQAQLRGTRRRRPVDTGKCDGVPVPYGSRSVTQNEGFSSVPCPRPSTPRTPSQCGSRAAQAPARRKHDSLRSSGRSALHGRTRWPLSPTIGLSTQPPACAASGSLGSAAADTARTSLGRTIVRRRRLRSWPSPGYSRPALGG